MKIEFNLMGDEDRRGARRSATVVAGVPEVGEEYDGWEVIEAYQTYLDPEQPSSEVSDYEFYTLELREKGGDEDATETREYVCVRYGDEGER